MERLDDLECNGLKVYQNTNGYCFSIDSVLLANFVKAQNTDTVLELCSGSGVISFLIEGHQSPAQITGVELQKSLFDLSLKSLSYNKLQNKISFLNIPVQQVPENFKGKKFDIVVCNPPYNKVENIKSPNIERNIAMQEVELDFKQLCDCASTMLSFGGKFYFIYRADRIDEVLNILDSYNLETKVMQFVHPNEHKNARFVLICAVLGGKTNVNVLPPQFLNS